MIDRAKVSINPFDSKRYWLNSVESVPFGHYSISDWEEPRAEEEQAFHMIGSFSAQEREHLERIDDAPMARLRDIQKRQEESSASTVPVRRLPKRSHRMIISMEDLKSLRDV